MFRTRPPAGRNGAASRVTRKTAERFVARIAFHRESSGSESGVGPPRPAPLTKATFPARRRDPLHHGAETPWPCRSSAMIQRRILMPPSRKGSTFKVQGPNRAPWNLEPETWNPRRRAPHDERDPTRGCTLRRTGSLFRRSAGNPRWSRASLSLRRSSSVFPPGRPGGARQVVQQLPLAAVAVLFEARFGVFLRQPLQHQAV